MNSESFSHLFHNKMKLGGASDRCTYPKLFMVIAVCVIVTLMYVTCKFNPAVIPTVIKSTTSFDDVKTWDVWKKYMLNFTSDSTSTAKDELKESVNKIRILCLILTMERDLETKVDAVNKTWATRCDKHFYVIYSKQQRRDFLNIDIPDHRNNLVLKMQEVYKIVFEKYINDFDFLLKADDDTYIVVENLKFLLWHYESSKPGYLGFHFNKFVTNGYMSGGAGYVISNRGLRDLVTEGYQKKICKIEPRIDDPENSEDIETGRCLEKVGVPVLSSLDIQGRETFHAYTLDQYLSANLPAYIYSWAKNPILTGEQCCAKYVISFHYMTPGAIYFLDHLLYKTRVFGTDDSTDIQAPSFRIGPVT